MTVFAKSDITHKALFNMYLSATQQYVRIVTLALHTQEVTGSNPVAPTTDHPSWPGLFVGFAQFSPLRCGADSQEDAAPGVAQGAGSVNQKVQP